MSGQTALQRNYAELLARIRASAQLHAREPGTVNLLAVSKTFDAASVVELVDSGQRAFGENYLQEALAKISDCRARRPELKLEWHFIGPIQTNKTRQIAQHFDWVHSIERDKVATRLSEQRPSGMEPLNVCVQVNISGEASKSGCTPEELPALAMHVERMPGLRLRGLMALPEPSDDPARQREQYAAVRALFESLRKRLPALDTLSIGMSSDLDAAIAEGATLVRVGTALFGSRAPVRARALSSGSVMAAATDAALHPSQDPSESQMHVPVDRPAADAGHQPVDSAAAGTRVAGNGAADTEPEDARPGACARDSANPDAASSNESR